MLIFDTDNNIMSAIPRMLALKLPEIDVIRYITPETGEEKCIKATEVAAIAATGGLIKLGIVYETGGADETSGAGRAAGSFAVQYMTNVLRAPKNAVIWYTQDRDATATQMPGIKAAFAAFKAQLNGMYRLGCYGSGYCCDALKAAELIALIWLTDSVGFSGSRASIAAKRYDMLQHLPLTQWGLDTDPDLAIEAGGADLGFFVPAVTPPASVEARSAPDVAWLQVKLILAGHAVAVDGVWGPQTAEAVAAYQAASAGLTGNGTADARTMAALNRAQA